MERKMRRIPENQKDLSALLKERSQKAAEAASILEDSAAVTLAYIAGRLDGVLDAMKFGKQSA